MGRVIDDEDFQFSRKKFVIFNLFRVRPGCVHQNMETEQEIVFTVQLFVL